MPFVQFKKHEKHPWRSVAFSKGATLPIVALFHGCYSRFIYFEWYQINQLLYIDTKMEN